MGCPAAGSFGFYDGVSSEFVLLSPPFRKSRDSYAVCTRMQHARALEAGVRDALTDVLPSAVRIVVPCKRQTDTRAILRIEIGFLTEV